MNPETPLPWTDVRMIRNDYCSPQDLQFSMHAVNAYPKLVNFLKSFAYDETINTGPVIISECRCILKELEEL